MTEREAFEARFATAILGYVGRLSSELDPVELAHRIAAREPRRQGLSRAVALPVLRLPARVWVVLLLAALLTGLVAGALVVGSRPPELPAVVSPARQLFACPAGTNPDVPGRVDQARPVQQSESTSVHILPAFDRQAGRIVVIALGPDRSETWTFDVCTNTWAQMHPRHEPPIFEWGELVYDASSDVTLLTASGKVWAYDRGDDDWTEMAPAPAEMSLWVYEPRSGLVIAGSNSLATGMWTYDVETDIWTAIDTTVAVPNGPYVYDAAVDRIVAAGFEAWQYDIYTRAWSGPGATRPAVIAGYGMSSPDVVYDEAAERTVVFGNQRLVAYDASADSWEIVLDGPDWLPNPIVYDPVNHRLVGMGLGGVVGYVAAFDLGAREWTRLLESDESPG